MSCSQMKSGVNFGVVNTVEFLLCGNLPEEIAATIRLLKIKRLF